jgi:hypothetical protein
LNSRERIFSKILFDQFKVRVSRNLLQFWLHLLQAFGGSAHFTEGDVTLEVCDVGVTFRHESGVTESRRDRVKEKRKFGFVVAGRREVDLGKDDLVVEVVQTLNLILS